MRILNTNQILSNRILIPKYKYHCNTEVLTVPFQLEHLLDYCCKKKVCEASVMFFFHFCVFISSISFTISFTSISAREVNLQWKETGEGLLDTWNYNSNARCYNFRMGWGEFSNSNIAWLLIVGVKHIRDPTTNDVISLLFYVIILAHRVCYFDKYIA